MEEAGKYQDCAPEDIFAERSMNCNAGIFAYDATCYPGGQFKHSYSALRFHNLKDLDKMFCSFLSVDISRQAKLSE